MSISKKILLIIDPTFFYYGELDSKKYPFFDVFIHFFVNRGIKENSKYVFSYHTMFFYLRGYVPWIYPFFFGCSLMSCVSIFV